MMLPIVASIVTVMMGAPEGPGAPDRAGRSAFASAAVLAVAYGASIGGVGTLIGTPPNAILAGYAAEWGLPPMSFTRWFWVGLPMVLVLLPVAWLVLTRVAIRVPGDPMPALREAITRERAGLGPVSRAEWSVFLVFMAAAMCWVFREPVGRGLGLIGIDAGGKKVERLHPYALLLPTAMAASLAFMLPMGTPPNALVFASGRVTIRQMAGAGLVMNLCAVAVITGMMYFLGPWLLGYSSRGTP
jgi:sodium-dependent dicarboxylate transporter 2/3/5